MDHTLKTADQLTTHLKSMRRLRGLTQTEAGARAALSQRRLSKLELEPSRMTVAQLLALAGALDFDVILRPRQRGAESPSKLASTADW